MTATVEIETATGQLFTQTFNITTAAKPTNPNAQLFRLDYVSPAPIATVQMKDQPRRNILFGESGVPGCVGAEVFELTREMIALVDSIIATFDRFF